MELFQFSQCVLLKRLLLWLWACLKCVNSLVCTHWMSNRTYNLFQRSLLGIFEQFNVSLEQKYKKSTVAIASTQICFIHLTTFLRRQRKTLYCNVYRLLNKCINYEIKRNVIISPVTLFLSTHSVLRYKRKKNYFARKIICKIYGWSKHFF